MEILVNVIGQKLKIATNLKCFVSGSQQFVKFTFNMDDSWDNLQTFAQFRQNDVAYNQYLDANNSVYLPSEIVAGTCTLILYGTGDDVRATTNYLTLTIDENILVTNAQSTEITQSLYEQLVNSVTTTTNRLQDRVANVENVIQGLAGGAPIVVSSVSAMTDTEQIYVLSTDGKWYYHNGSAWVAGGEYGAVATDTTLTQSGIPADAKAVGDAIKNNKGLSDTAAALLISILGNALYTSNQSDAIQALEEALIEGDIVRVTGITLSSSSKTVEYGSTAQITANVTPANATNRTVIWTSSDESIATVSNGTITGVGVGNATITAKTVDGGFTASCTVSVTVENLLKTEDATTGAYIDRDTGSAMPSDSWTATDYIWLKPNTTYYSEGCFLENFYSFYDENKNHVSSPPSGITIEFGPDRNWGAKRKGTIAMGSQGYYFRGSYNTAIQYTPYIALTTIE